MQKKLIIDGVEADYNFHLRTTPKLIDTFREKCFDKNISINALINRAMVSQVKKWQSKNTK